jgi:MFS family permease
MYYTDTLHSIKKLKINPIVKALIASDFLVWSGVNLISPIIAIFIIERVAGGTIGIIGLATTIYFISRAIFEVPVGILIDKKKGENDDLFVAVLGMIIFGTVYLLFPSITEVWQLLVAQAILGMSCAISFPGWYSLFTRHIDKEKEAFEWSLHDVLLGSGIAACAAIGAFVAEKYGFDIVFYIAGGLIIFGGLSLLLIKDKINKPI